mmetsp:Transcript_63215/g.148886  ORF Transcript_63215/g.148886 Transcript_63215/m.148886 type:complete len:123 (+) Transcript_63215:1677-2045(+)
MTRQADKTLHYPTSFLPQMLVLSHGAAELLQIPRRCLACATRKQKWLTSLSKIKKMGKSLGGASFRQRLLPDRSPGSGLSSDSTDAVVMGAGVGLSEEVRARPDCIEAADGQLFLFIRIFEV